MLGSVVKGADGQSHYIIPITTSAVKRNADGIEIRGEWPESDMWGTGLARDKAASSVCTRTRDRVLFARCLMRVRDPYSVQ